MNSKVIQDSIYQQSHFLATILRITQLSAGYDKLPEKNQTVRRNHGYLLLIPWPLVFVAWVCGDSCHDRGMWWRELLNSW